MKRIFVLFIFLFSTTPAQKHEITGIVKDKETGQPLAYASIRIGGTTYGTASNLEGSFNLKLEEGNYKLIFSFVGYKADTLQIQIPFKSKLNIALQQDAVKLEEVVVNANEDPAYRIIREAIKRKRENRKGLNNFEYNAYSKKIVKSAGEIAAIEETFIKGYNKIDAWEKEFILSLHRTENQGKNVSPIDITLADKYYIDFSRDTLSILMNVVYLPLADNAFNYYDYKLLEATEGKTGNLYKIKVIPRSKIQPLLKGEITIESGMYALNSVNLEINEGVRLPYVKNLSAKFIQQLGKYGNYWLPNYVKSEAGLEVSFQGLLGLERIEYDVINSITEYKINEPIPDSIEESSKQKYGHLTINIPRSNHELTRKEITELRPIPLTQPEIDAYANLDSTKTIEKMLKINGTLSGMVPDLKEEKDTTKSFFLTGLNFLDNYLNVGNNRVSGIVIGPKYKGSILNKNLTADFYLGYSFLRKKTEGEISLNYKLKKFFVNRLQMSFFHKPDHQQIFTPYENLLNSAAVMLGFEDQFNYYLCTGYGLELKRNFSRNLSGRFKLVFEKQRSMRELNYQRLFNTKKTPRINPSILEGNDNRVAVNFLLGKNPNELQLIPESGLITQIDISNPVFNSDFNYKRISVKGQFLTKTFYDELFIAPYLNISFDAGLITGNYGKQHLFTPSVALGFFSPQGTFKGLKPYEYSGTEMLALHIEHNWRTIPFQALGLDFISDLFIDLVTGVSGLKVWNNSSFSQAHVQDKPYWEIYAGISKILGLFRLDVSYNSFNKVSITAALASVL